MCSCLENVITSLHKQTNKIGDKMMEFNNIIINEVKEYGGKLVVKFELSADIY